MVPSWWDCQWSLPVQVTNRRLCREQEDGTHEIRKRVKTKDYHEVAAMRKIKDRDLIHIPYTSIPIPFICHERWNIKREKPWQVSLTSRFNVRYLVFDVTLSVILDPWALSLVFQSSRHTFLLTVEMSELNHPGFSHGLTFFSVYWLLLIEQVPLDKYLYFRKL